MNFDDLGRMAASLESNSWRPRYPTSNAQKPLWLGNAMVPP